MARALNVICTPFVDIRNAPITRLNIRILEADRDVESKRYLSI